MPVAWLRLRAVFEDEHEDQDEANGKGGCIFGKIGEVGPPIGGLFYPARLIENDQDIDQDQTTLLTSQTKRNQRPE